MLTDGLTFLYAGSERMRRLVAIGLTTAALFFIVAGLYAIFSTMSSAYANLQERRQYLGRLQLITETARNLSSSATQASAPSDGIFLKGGNKEVIGAELQTWLGQTADEAGVELQSIENAAVEDSKTQAYVGLSATLAGSWKSVQNLVFKIETAQPMLFVRDVDIQSMSYSEEDNVEPRVTMRISFFGVLKPSQAKGGV